MIDNIERAVAHMPAELAGNPWAEGVANVAKNLDAMLSSLGMERIAANPGDEFNPELHDAIQVDEEASGEKEVIAELLRSGYLLHGRPLRHAMVKVTRQ